MNSNAVCPITDVIHGVLQLSSLIQMHGKCLGGKAWDMFRFMGNSDKRGKKRDITLSSSGLWEFRHEDLYDFLGCLPASGYTIF